MKRSTVIISIAIVLVAIAGAVYLFPEPPPEMLHEQVNSENIAANAFVTYSNAELGLEFKYLDGSVGYTLKELNRTDEAVNLIKTIVLTRAEDQAREVPVGGEGPPTITIQIFGNPEKQWPQTWADKHIQYSNINLKIGDSAEAAVGGAKAVRYASTGLYSADNAVVTHGGSVYLFTGMFQREDSQIRKDFQPLLDSVKFIQRPGEI